MHEFVNGIRQFRHAFMSTGVLLHRSQCGSDLAVNSAYRELLGRSMEEVRGYRYLAYVHPDDRAVAGDKWRAFCLGQVKEYVENFRWTHPRGEKTLQVKGGHRPNGQHYGIVTDLTDHLLYHEKLRKVKDYALE